MAERKSSESGPSRPPQATPGPSFREIIHLPPASHHVPRRSSAIPSHLLAPVLISHTYTHHRALSSLHECHVHRLTPSQSNPQFSPDLAPNVRPLPAPNTPHPPPARPWRLRRSVSRPVRNRQRGAQRRVPRPGGRVQEWEEGQGGMEGPAEGGAVRRVGHGPVQRCCCRGGAVLWEG